MPTTSNALWRGRKSFGRTGEGGLPSWAPEGPLIRPSGTFSPRGEGVVRRAQENLKGEGCVFAALPGERDLRQTFGLTVGRPQVGGISMLDLIIRGGDVVTPQGVAKCDVAIKGETIAAVAAPGTLADARRGPRHRCGGQDRHARRHRSARAHAASVHDAGRQHPLHAGARPGRHGGALRRHHHADRLRLRDGRPQRAEGNRGARRSSSRPRAAATGPTT